MYNLEKDIADDWQLLDDLFEERAAIIEYDGQYSRFVAEEMAAQRLGFENKWQLKQHIQKLKANQK